MQGAPESITPFVFTKAAPLAGTADRRR